MELKRPLDQNPLKHISCFNGLFISSFNELGFTEPCRGLSPMFSQRLIPACLMIVLPMLRKTAGFSFGANQAPPSFNAHLPSIRFMRKRLVGPRYFFVEECLFYLMINRINLI